MDHRVTISLYEVQIKLSPVFIQRTNVEYFMLVKTNNNNNNNPTPLFREINREIKKGRHISVCLF